MLLKNRKLDFEALVSALAEREEVEVPVAEALVDGDLHEVQVVEVVVSASPVETLDVVAALASPTAFWIPKLPEPSVVLQP